MLPYLWLAIQTYEERKEKKSEGLQTIPYTKLAYKRPKNQLNSFTLNVPRLNQLKQNVKMFDLKGKRKESI